MKFKNAIKSQEVYDFKETFCDENQIICQLLLTKVASYLISPILDIGAGTGDIAYKALVNKKVIMIDKNKISEHDYLCRPGHVRKQCDFFEYNGEEQINTVLISHTLQFIDDDIQTLNEKIADIDPTTLIQIINTNDDFMGDLIQWSFENYDNPNPEKKLSGYPLNYSLIKSYLFTATLKCPDYKALAQQVSYLMLMDLRNVEESLIKFLMKKLREPQFTINQVIEIYRKNEQ